jgi:farnesyl-diphosphate farnesyltransferase
LQTLQNEWDTVDIFHLIHVQGMAEFCAGKQVITMEDYNLYTHYVAGLVGHGLTGLFVQSGLEDPSLESVPHLANHMGLFLQKTNILKDYLADIKEGRLFWPKSVWELYVPDGEGVESLALPENLDRALACLNHLCVDALELVPDTLEYLSRLSNKTVFQFAAIPQLMALASMDHFYNNPLLFQKSGNKIRRGLAVKLMMLSGDMDSVKQVYYNMALKLNEKNRKALGQNDRDQTFLKMSAATSNVLFLIFLNPWLDYSVDSFAR